jgi:kinesin family member 11
MSKKEEDVTNVKVVVRSRPINKIEKIHPVSIKTIPKRKEVIVHSKNIEKSFILDHVFSPNTTQKELFDSCIKPLVDEVLQGYNCTIFAYGQTSTGKTYTMEGKRGENNELIEEEQGVIPRCVEHIVNYLKKQKSEYTIKLSCLELYNEEIQDLLSNEKKQIRLFDEKNKSVNVQGLEEKIVKDCSDIMKILDDAALKRQIAETELNKASSRSHVITNIIIHMKENTIDGEDFVKTGKLYLVDLAGSENIGRSGAINKRAQEAGMINQSLLTLGRVINALVEKREHIPYRESKLTRLLRDSLGGKTKTCIIATISPSQLNLEETISTLEYAQRAKSIKNQPQQNKKLIEHGYIKSLSLDNEKLKMELQLQREKSGIYISNEEYNEKNNLIDELTQKVETLEERLVEEKNSNGELTETIIKKDEELKELNETKEKLESFLREEKRENENNRKRIVELEYQLKGKEYVIEEKERHEKLLYSDAEILLKYLKISLSDNEKLLEKSNILELNEKENFKNFKMMNENFKKEVEVFYIKLDEYFNKSKAIKKEMEESIDTFSGNDLKLENKITEKVSEIEHIFESMTQIIVELTEERNDENTENIMILNKDNAIYIDNVKKGLNEMTDRLKSTIQKIKEYLEENKVELNEIFNLISNQFDESEIKINKFYTLNEEIVEKIRERFQKKKLMEEEKYDENKKRIFENIEYIKVENKEAKNKMMMSIESLISETLSKIEYNHYNSMSNTLSTFENIKKENQENDQNNLKSFVEKNEDLLKFKNEMSERNKGSLGLIDKNKKKIEEHNEKINSEKTNILNNVIDYSIDFSNNLSTFSNSFSNKIHNEEVQMEEYKKEVKESIKNKIEENTQLNSQLREHMNESKKEKSEILIKIKNQTNQNLENNKIMIADEKSNYNSAQNSNDNFQKKYIMLNKKSITPKKIKDWKFNENLKMSKPYLEMYNEYKEKFEFKEIKIEDEIKEEKEMKEEIKEEEEEILSPKKRKAIKSEIVLEQTSPNKKRKTQIMQKSKSFQKGKISMIDKENKIN